MTEIHQYQLEMFPLTERERFWRHSHPYSNPSGPYDKAVREQQNEADRKQRRLTKLKVIP